MKDAKKIQTAKSLWKFVFIREDDIFKKHRSINRRALQILLSSIVDSFCTEIRNNPLYFSVSGEMECRLQLIGLMCRYKEIYLAVSDDVKRITEAVVKSNEKGAMWVSWFMYDDERDLLQKLLVADVEDPNYETINILYNRYCSLGLDEEINDFFIERFYRSSSFDIADLRYGLFIKPYLKFFKERQLEDLIEKINLNSQCNGRRAARISNSEIAKEVVNRFGSKFDFSKYEFFLFDNSII